MASLFIFYLRISGSWVGPCGGNQIPTTSDGDDERRFLFTCGSVIHKRVS